MSQFSTILYCLAVLVVADFAVFAVFATFSQYLHHVGNFICPLLLQYLLLASAVFALSQYLTAMSLLILNQQKSNIWEREMSLIIEVFPPWLAKQKQNVWKSIQFCLNWLCIDLFHLCNSPKQCCVFVKSGAHFPPSPKTEHLKPKTQLSQEIFCSIFSKHFGESFLFVFVNRKRCQSIFSHEFSPLIQNYFLWILETHMNQI